MSGFDWLACPHCHQRLRVVDQVAGCSSGHRFDLARQGYLNLLARAAGHNADTAAMLAQRQAFLDAGHYQPITDALVDAVVPTAGVHAPARLAEMGAGTGHYLSAVLDALPAAEGLGLDVSPAAARRLARAHPRMRAIVADVWQPLPLLDQCLDVLLSVFAPRNPAEFARVLRPGGRLITVTPGAGHLAEARAVFGLMDIQPDKDQRLATSLWPLFTRGRSREVRFTLALDEPAMAALVGMGPNALHEHRAVSALVVGVEVSVTEGLPC